MTINKITKSHVKQDRVLERGVNTPKGSRKKLKGGRSSLIWNLVLIVLDHVIGFAAPAEVAVTDDLPHVVGSLSLSGGRSKSLAELFNGVTTEARQPCIQHQGHHGDNSFLVRPAKRVIHDQKSTKWPEHHINSPQRQVSLHTQLLKPAEGRWLRVAAHNHDHLISQLDVRLPTQVAARWALK